MSHVVLVHGFLVGPASTWWLRQKLHHRGFSTHAFAYPTRTEPLDQTLDRLSSFAKHLDTDRLDWVGHSLGGLILLALLARSQSQGVTWPPGRVVLLGSPVRGSTAAQGLAAHPWGRWLLGEAGQNLSKCFAMAPPTHPTTVIRGTRSLGLGQCFGGLPKPNDGTVAVSETELHGAQTIDVHTSHSGLLFSPQVVNHIAEALV